MPEPTPTTDAKGKKPNKTVLILGAAGIAVFIFILYKSKKAKEESQVPYTSQAFIPVTGENVAGAGASQPFGGGGIGGGVGGVETAGVLTQAQRENTELITNFLREERESRTAEQKARGEQPIAVTITGGGAPSSGQIGSGAGTASPPSGGTNPSPPRAPHCPSDFPNYSSRGCWKYSRERCPDKARPYKHVYQNGTVICASS